MQAELQPDRVGEDQPWNDANIHNDTLARSVMDKAVALGKSPKKSLNPKSIPLKCEVSAGKPSRLP